MYVLADGVIVNMPYRKIDRGDFSLLHKGHWKPSAIATDMDCSTRTCYRWEKRVRMYGHLEPFAPTRPGPNRKIHMAALESMMEYLRRNPCTYQDEMKSFLQEEWGIDVSQPTISTRLKEMKQSLKTGQRVGPQSQELRTSWQVDMVRMRAEQLVFFDECNFKEQSCWQMMAYGPIGEATRYHTSINRGDTWSLMPAYSVDGYLPCTALKKGYFNADEVYEWVVNELLPHCNAFPGPRSVICLDNVSIHCKERIRQAVEGKGCLIRYLPPYSPDYNPIELTFSILKAWMRRHFHHYRDAFRGDFGGFIRFALENSGCDRKAQEHFRHSPAGYQFEGDYENYMEELRRFECEVGEI